VPATVNALYRSGLEVSVLGLWDSALEEMATPYEGSSIHAVGSWPTPGLGVAPTLDRTLEDFDPDIVHLHGLWLYPSIATLRWRRRTGKPTVISPHGMLDQWALANSSWKKRLALASFERANLNCAACLHALNLSELESFRALGLRNPVAVIPNGVELSDLAGVGSDYGPLKADERRVLLFLGRIHPKKGLEETIAGWSEACSLAPSIAKGWVLAIAGWDDGGHLRHLRRQVADLGLEDNVHFLGPVFGQDKADLLRRADAFILASYSEGLPMSVLEAWSFSLPVFMTKACNIPEGFETGSAAEISTNPGSIAETMVHNLGTENFDKMGLAGQDLVKRRFTWDRVAQDLIAVYLWLVGQGDRPDCVDLA